MHDFNIRMCYFICHFKAMRVIDGNYSVMVAYDMCESSVHDL